VAASWSRLNFLEREARGLAVAEERNSFVLKIEPARGESLIISICVPVCGVETTNGRNALLDSPVTTKSRVSPKSRVH